MQRLLLVDGNAIMHRAYHALPPLTTNDGKVVNAVYGFASMLLRVTQDLKPTHIAVTFDRPEPTFRKEMFADYQAHRPAMEDNLSSQFPIVKEVLTTMGIAMFEKAGYEADDLLGSIAKQVQSSKFKVQSENGKLEIDEVVIVTGDRDILQLVDDNIKVYMPIKGLSEGKLFDRAAVKEKFGLAPSQIVDYKSLIGDSSDNYPGVKGIGPKTAADLLSQFHSVEKIYEEIDKNIRSDIFVSERTIEALKTYRKDALMCKKLATIECTVPIDVNLEKLVIQKFYTPEVVTLFESLQFKSLLKRLLMNDLGDIEETPVVKKADEKKKIIDNDNQLGLF